MSKTSPNKETVVGEDNHHPLHGQVPDHSNPITPTKVSSTTPNLVSDPVSNSDISYVLL